MKLSDYAKSRGISYKTALRMFHRGEIENATQMPSGTILIEDVQEDSLVDMIVAHMQNEYDINVSHEDVALMLEDLRGQHGDN